MKQKRAYRTQTPMDIAVSLWADGGALIQTYNADVHTFVPNRELTPLYVRVSFYGTDKDGKTSGSLVPKIANINWYEVINKERKVILSDNSNYQIIRDNSNYNGSIAVIRNNVPFDETLTLEFTGEYLNTRTNQVIQLTQRVLLRTVASADAPLSLKLDCGTLVKHNLIEFSQDLTINAQMFLGSLMVADAARKKHWWYQVNADKTETLITGSVQEQIWYKNGAGTGSLTIDKENIYDSIHLRCKAEHVSATEAAPNAPTQESLSADVVISREYPKYEEEVLTADELDFDVKTGYMEAEVATSKGVIANPSRYFFIRFFVKPVKAGSVWTEVGHGDSAKYDAVSALDSSTNQAADLAIEVTPHTGYAIAADSAGNLLTDNSGNLLLIR